MSESYSTEVSVSGLEAFVQIGRMAAEYISEQETWPAFFTWLSGKHHIESNRSAGMRRNVLSVLAALPPAPDRNEIARHHPTRQVRL